MTKRSGPSTDACEIPMLFWCMLSPWGGGRLWHVYQTTYIRPGSEDRQGVELQASYRPGLTIFGHGKAG